MVVAASEHSQSAVLAKQSAKEKPVKPEFARRSDAGGDAEDTS